MSKKPTEQPPAMTREVIEQLIITVVRRELSSLVAKADERSKGTGSKVTKRTVSIPRNLWEQFQAEFPGETSGHVATALRLLLATRQTGQA